MKTLKKITLVLFMLAYSLSSYSQVSISDKADQQADPSAVLDLISTDRGLLIPRMETTDDRDAIPTDIESESLLIFNKQTQCFETYIGGEWHEFWCAEIVSGCEGYEDGVGGFEIEYDGYTYELVEIGDQCWFAENLAYLPEITYEDDWGSESDPQYAVYGYEPGSGTENISDAKATSEYNDYGVLYNWSAAGNACPEGWSLPSHDDWTELERYVCEDAENADCEDEFPYDTSTDGWQGTDEGDRLKASGDAVWCNSTCNDDYSFAVLPGGFRYSNGSFDFLGSYGVWWSSTEDGTNAWSRFLISSNSAVYRNSSNKAFGYSVRCLRD